MDAQELERLAALSVDGELDPREDAELQQLLAGDPRCRALFEAQLRNQEALRDKLQAADCTCCCPDDLATRIHTQLSREARGRAGLPWRRALPATLAVALLAVLVLASSGTCPYTDRVVRAHSLSPPAEVRALDGPSEVQRFLDRNLRFQVTLPRLPPAPRGPRLVGARLLTLTEAPAAYLIYDQGGARVSCFVFSRRPFGAGVLTQTQVGGRDLRVGRMHRYNVVSWDDAELTYVLVSDVDLEELQQLASAE